MGASLPNNARGRRSPVSTEETDAVFNAAARDQSVYGARDAAIIILVCETGIDLADLIALQVEDFDPDAAGISLFRNGIGIDVPLGPAACRTLEHWLDFRGRPPGALINPIRRPDRILYKPLTSTAVRDALFRRSYQAGVLPFTASDVARTISMRISGRWHAAPRRPFEKGLSTRNPAEAASATRNLGQLLVVRFLSRHGHERRTTLLERLDRLALLISGGTRRAFEFDWTGVRATQFPPAGGAFGCCGLRVLNKMKNALHGVLREGVKVGVVDQQVYTGIVAQRWNDASGKGRFPQSSGAE
jgi:hypothetical protein